MAGNTRITESQLAYDVVHLLNNYLDQASAAIRAEGGFVDKFIGDGIMATFGTPDAGPRDALNALSAALSMQDAFAAWQANTKSDGARELRLSVGLHYGPVTIGNIGSAERLEFAVLGDTVNLAARVEGLTKS